MRARSTSTSHCRFKRSRVWVPMEQLFTTVQTLRLQGESPANVFLVDSGGNYFRMAQLMSLEPSTLASQCA